MSTSSIDGRRGARCDGAQRGRRVAAERQAAAVGHHDRLARQGALGKLEVCELLDQLIVALAQPQRVLDEGQRVECCVRLRARMAMKDGCEGLGLKANGGEQQRRGGVGGSP